MQPIPLPDLYRIPNQPQRTPPIPNSIERPLRHRLEHRISRQPRESPEFQYERSSTCCTCLEGLVGEDSVDEVHAGVGDSGGSGKGGEESAT